MKKGSRILLLICAFSFCLVIGIFIGLNLSGHYAELPQDSATETISGTVNVSEETQDFRLDINSATKVQLMELPGIGELIAERIISYRTENGSFLSTDDLMNIDGIGEKKLQQIEALIKVGG